MEERKGLFTKEQEGILADIADDATDFTNPLLEGLDGPIFRQAIALLDNLVFEKINPEAKAIITPIVDEIIAALPTVE